MSKNQLCVFLYTIHKMSDTKYSVVAAVKAKKNIAIIDDDWIGDSLSDDGEKISNVSV